MNQILASWMYVSDKANSSHLPSSKGHTSKKKIQDIYWRCLACNYFTAHYYNPGLRLMFFGNENHLPIVDGVSFADLFQKWGVEIHCVPFRHAPPKGYYKTWGHTFYEFSIFEYVTHILKDDDLFMLVDSDCVTTGDIIPIFEKGAKHEFIGYQVGYTLDHVVNGNSREGLKAIYQQMSQIPINDCPPYYGGELHLSTVKFIRRLMMAYEPAWRQQLIFFDENKPRLYTEEHLLSYLYFLLGATSEINANSYIKRLWTDPTTYRNVLKEDESLLLWHLPAEKRYGFFKLFHWLASQDFDLEKIAELQLKAKMKTLFSIPTVPPSRKLFYSIKGVIKKVLKKIPL